MSKGVSESLKAVEQYNSHPFVRRVDSCPLHLDPGASLIECPQESRSLPPTSPEYPCSLLPRLRACLEFLPGQSPVRLCLTEANLQKQSPANGVYPRIFFCRGQSCPAARSGRPKPSPRCFYRRYLTADHPNGHLIGGFE